MRTLSCRAYLELLAREAAGVEFDGPLLQARAAGAAPAVLEDLEQAKHVALRVRALLERRRRRELELSALFDTASDLAALRGLDAVLEAIVRRARQLLNTDVAYMTLRDAEQGDIAMRVTDGCISARFQRLRLPIGAGLGGLVAQTGSPYATSSYFDDARFRHTAEIDAAVAEEGLVAILGVPMRLGSRVIGVLYAANRSARPFAREETALLGSLAAHAAVAFDTARLLEETRAALEELSAANELIRAHSQSVERAAAAHDRMTELVARGGGLEDVAAAVTDTLGGGLVMLDSEGRTLAAVGDTTELGARELAATATAAQATGRAARHGQQWAAPVTAGAEHLGTLVLHPAGEVDGADQRILERAALVTAVLLLFRRSVAEAEERVRGELLDELFTRPIRTPEALRERARRLGCDLDSPHVVVTVHYSGAPQRRAAAWAAAHAAAQGGLAAERNGEVVLLLPGEKPGAAARAAAEELGAVLESPATAGAAGPAAGPEAIAAAYREAVRCTEALRALGRQGQGAGAQELGFAGLLIGDHPEVGRFVDAQIGPVLAYDTRRGTALTQTLETYFASGGSLTRTARAVHVHVNTVTQRLDRVAQLLGEDWHHPDRALEIQLALRLQRLRANLEGGQPPSG